MKKSWLIAGILLLLPRWGLAADKILLEESFRKVPEQYILPVDVETVAMRFLKGISAVDKNLKVGNDRDKISLYYKGQLVKSRFKPQDKNDVAEWVEASSEIMDLAVKKSSLAEKYDFKMADLMWGEAIKAYDKDSKFYFSPEDQKINQSRRLRNTVTERRGDNLYIRLRAFNAASRQMLEKALGENSDAKGIILDLRGSPGGMLSEAVELADLFIDEGIAASVKSRQDTVYYNTKPGDMARGKKMVVLVDGNTASSAEVLAAALQEQSRAKLVGTLTYGKGTQQNLIELSDGAVLALTHALVYTPSGKRLDHRGVLPNYCTFEMPETKNIENLLKLGENNPCPAEDRSESSLDFAVAEELLKR